MFRCLLAYLGVALSLSICPASAQTGLPYDNDYEAAEGFVAGAALSAVPWSTGSSGATITAADFASDAQSVLLPDTSAGFLSASFSGAQTGGIVFVDFYLKPAAGIFEDLPEEATDLSSALTGLVDDAGTGWLYVVHGDGQGGGAWQRVNTEIPLTSGVATNWVRFTYRLNYTTKTWDLYLDDKLVATDLRFLDDVLTQFTEFRLKGGGLAPVYFDFFYAGYDNPVYVDTDKDGISDAYETANLLNNLADDRNGDADFDGVSNILEFMRDMEAGNPDTDGDGVHDGWELSFGADPLTADPYALSVVPFTDSFEGHPATGLTSANGWLFQGGDEPEVSAEAAVTGAQSAKITGNDTENVQLYNLFSSQSGSVVWVDLNVKPGSIDTEPALGAMTSAGFYFGPDGLLRVFDGAELPAGAWKMLDHRPVDTSDWQRLTIRLNYPVQRFSLYLDGKRVAHNYGFANPVPYFQSFSLIEGSSTGSSYLDDVSIAYLEPGALDNDGDGLLNSEEDINLDGIVDAGETDPESTDTDVDGVGDWVEGLFGLSPTVAETYTLPAVQPDGSLLWEHGFESAEGFSLGSINSQLGWQASGTSTVTDSEAIEGTQALSVTAADSTAFTFSGWDGVSEVWVSFRAKLLPGVLPEASSFEGPVSAVFGLNQGARLAALDTNAGEWLFTEGPVAEGWQDYTIFLNYRDKTWDLLLNGVIQFTDIGFTDPRLPHFARFQVRNDSEVEIDGESLIDAVAISNAEPAGLDFDGDGLDNALERSLGSDVLLTDSDGDLMPDAWEYQYGFDLIANDAGADSDGDGLSNLGEYQFGFDPSVADIAGVTGFVNRDIYNGISGNLVSQLTASSNFPLQPDMRTLLSELTTDYSESGNSNYGQRIRGTITAPVTGSYTFWIAGDNGCEFWLSTDETVFNKQLMTWIKSSATNYKQWDRYGPQRSLAVILEAGQEYYFEVLHKESTGKDHVSVAWNYPGQSRQVVPGQYLKTVTPDPNDFDEDGLSDDWEILVGLDPLQGHGSNGYAGDPDGDGLTNHQEQVAGTDPLSADTDGDGLSDSVELYESRTNPLIAEFTGQNTVVTSLDGSAFTIIDGDWNVSGTSAIAQSLRGALEYSVNLTSAGAYRLEVTGKENNPYASIRDFDLSVYIDGVPVGSSVLRAGPTTSSLASWYLPWVDAGAHTIRLVWHNGTPGSLLEVLGLELIELGSVDSDSNGIPDWLDSRMASTSAFSEQAITSYISPLTIEGSTQFPDLLDIVGSYIPAGAVDGVVPAQAGLEGKFFANVPLDSDAVTQITVTEVGALTQYTVDATWAVFNVVDHTEMWVRPGDSLMLSAFHASSLPADSVTITVQAVGASSGDVFSLTAADSVIYEFTQSGEFEVIADYIDENSQLAQVTTTVSVIGADLSPEPIVFAYSDRDWTINGLDDRVIFEVDPLISLLELTGSTDYRKFDLFVSGSGNLITRLVDDGPIISALSLEALVSQHTEKGKWDIVETFDDGTAMWKGVIDLGGPVPDDLVVTLDIFKAGVTFDDGTIFRTITAADFSSDGTYTYYLLRPPSTQGSVCHRVKFYQDDDFLGLQY